MAQDHLGAQACNYAINCSVAPVFDDCEMAAWSRGGLGVVEADLGPKLVAVTGVNAEEEFRARGRRGAASESELNVRAVSGSKGSIGGAGLLTKSSMHCAFIASA